MVIALLNQKGGAGKTTLALHLAAGLCERGCKVQVIDADPQGSALDWLAMRANSPEISPSPFGVIAMPRPILHREIERLSAGFDHVLIDGPPRVYEVARSAILAADLVLIPVQPSPYDVWAAKEIVDLVQEASTFKEKQKCRFTINRKIVNTAIGRDVADALSGYKIPLMVAEICQRVGFAECAARGQTVLETEPKSMAAEEIRALTAEVLAL